MSTATFSNGLAKIYNQVQPKEEVSPDVQESSLGPEIEDIEVITDTEDAIKVQES